MNDREHQTISIVNIILAVTLVTVFAKLFRWGWQRSKVGTILVIILSPYLLMGMSKVLDGLNYKISCGVQPNHPACVKNPQTEALAQSLQKAGQQQTMETLQKLVHIKP